MPEPRRITIPRSSLFIVAFADSAGGRVTFGRAKSQRSRSAIVVLAQDNLEHLFCLKAWARHCTTDQLIDEIFATQEKWNPSSFGIDATGTQNLFADSLLREAREKHKKLPLVKWTFEGDKDYRIETTLQPLQSGGKLFAQKDQDDLRAEYEAFPSSNLKDLLDALVGAKLLLPTKPKAEEVRDEMAQYREYLRGQGVPPMTVEQRIKRELDQRSMNSV
jgi:hypothetical protein